MQTKYFTREEYLAASCDAGPAVHRRYFAQFVTLRVKQLVLLMIGRDEIVASKDPHMNDIPLRRWSALDPLIRSSAPSALACTVK